MDEFLTMLYEQYFQAVKTVDDLSKSGPVKAECTKCGFSELDANARDLQIARFDLNTWETVISAYLARFSTVKPEALTHAQRIPRS